MKKKKASLIAAEQAMDALLKRVGYTGKYKGKRPYDIPDYKVKSNLPPTSDKICGNGSKKEANKYTGTEIMGIGTMHKSNLVPVRRGTSEAIDIAQMRRN